MRTTRRKTLQVLCREPTGFLRLGCQLVGVSLLVYLLYSYHYPHLCWVAVGKIIDPASLKESKTYLSSDGEWAPYPSKAVILYVGSVCTHADTS